MFVYDVCLISLVNVSVSATVSSLTIYLDPYISFSNKQRRKDVSFNYAHFI